MRSSTWALELAGLDQRVTALEQILAGETPEDVTPWEAPADLAVPPTPQERERYDALMVRLEACRAGVDQTAHDFASHIAEAPQRRVAARRYAHS